MQIRKSFARIFKSICVLMAALMMSGYMVLMPSITNDVYADTDERVEVISDVAVSTALPNFDPDTSGDGVVGFVNRLYRIGLTREGEEAGVNFFVATLVGHYVSGGTVAQQILTSPEFQSHNYSNEDFVEILYRVFFNRNSDEAGRNYWIMAMSYGGTRNDVIFAFVQAYEWQEVCSNYGIDSGATNVVVTPAPTATNTPCPTSTNTPTPTSTPTPAIICTPEPTSAVPFTAEGDLEFTTNPVDSLFDVPYVSTYYFNPKPSVGENIEIPLYLTDANQSEYLYGDTSVRLDLIYEVDGVYRTISDVPAGDYTLSLGSLSEGMHTFSVQVLDRRTGMRSFRLYNDLWVINPSTYEISEAETYYMTEADLTRYGIHNDNSTNASDLITTRDGLTQLFEDTKSAGYRKIVLLPGTYRINGENARRNCILIPSYFTVDMNGATFKLDTITSENEGCIVSMLDVYDAHLINGTLEGDRFERQELGLETGYLGEAINTILINGGKYCSISNLTIRNTTGHTVVKTYASGPDLLITNYTNTAIINGMEVARDNCSTSGMMDLTQIIDWETDTDYMYVGHPWGYRGIKGDSAVVYVSFYDANQNFMETVTGYQYRKMAIPSGAKYARVTLLGTGFETSGFGNTVSIFTMRYGDYCAMTDLDFIDTRTCALAPAVCNNLLIEGCTFTRAGNSITPAAVDLEDGAQQCQDVYYRNNHVFEASGTMTVIDNYGFNHVFEDCTNHSFEVRARVTGGTIRNMNSGDCKITWILGDFKNAAYGRVYNNYCTKVDVKKGNDASHVYFKVKDCRIRAGWLTSAPDRVVYDNCVFPALSGGSARFYNCTIQPTACIGDQFYFYNCTFKILEGNDTTLTLNFNSCTNADRLFVNCNFEGKVTTNALMSSATFIRCTFDDFNFTASVFTGSTEEAIIFEDCAITSFSSNFMNVGPFTYNSGYLYVHFKHCYINFTGDRFIQFTSVATEGSQIIFENCNVSTPIDTSVAPDIIRVV